MTKQSVSFKHLKSTNREDGTVATYAIQVTDHHSEITEVLVVSPCDLASARNIAKILQGRSLVYRAKQQEHDQTIREMFENRSALI